MGFIQNEMKRAILRTDQNMKQPNAQKNYIDGLEYLIKIISIYKFISIVAILEAICIFFLPELQKWIGWKKELIFFGCIYICDNVMANYYGNFLALSNDKFTKENWFDGILFILQFRKPITSSITINYENMQNVNILKKIEKIPDYTTVMICFALFCLCGGAVTIIVSLFNNQLRTIATPLFLVLSLFWLFLGIRLIHLRHSLFNVVFSLLHPDIKC